MLGGRCDGSSRNGPGRFCNAVMFGESDDIVGSGRKEEGGRGGLGETSGLIEKLLHSYICSPFSTKLFQAQLWKAK